MFAHSATWNLTRVDDIAGLATRAACVAEDIAGKAGVGAEAKRLNQVCDSA